MEASGREEDAPADSGITDARPADRIYADPMTTFVTDKKGRPVSATISIVVAVLTLGYMLPWMIAALRGKSNHWGIFWINLLLGWTLIGLVAAFVMAVMPHRIAGVRE